ncbi:MAG: hypothetical protein WDW38_005775 [Sanguina aurantia]
MGDEGTASESEPEQQPSKRAKASTRFPDSGCVPSQTLNPRIPPPQAASHKPPPSHDPGSTLGTAHNTCKAAGCSSPPAPEVEGTEPSPYCPTHRDQIMMCYLSKGCLHPGCRSKPFYTKAGGRTAVYCEAHKRASSETPKVHRCQHEGCLVRPSFAMEGSYRPIFCRAHADPWMASTKGKRCRSPGCTVQPSFAHEGKAVCCAGGVAVSERKLRPV